MWLQKIIFYWLFAIATCVYYLLPVWAGIFVDEYGFSSGQIGYLLAADMAASTVGSALSRFWIHRILWRPMLFFVVTLSLVSNFACIAFDEFLPLLGLRYLAGIGMGAMSAFSFVVFGSAANPDREFSLSLVVQIILGALLLLFAIRYSQVNGVASTFVVLGVFSASFLPFILLAPKKSPAVRSEPETVEDGASKPNTWHGTLALCGIFIFFAGITGVWTSMERVGAGLGYDSTYIANALALAMGASLLGAFAPSILTCWLNRIRAILIGTIILAASIFGLAYVELAAAYLGFLLIFNFFYSFIIPYQSGLIAQVDRYGKLIVLLPAVQGIGIAAGPILAAPLIIDENYDNALLLGAIFAILSAFFLIMVALKFNDRKG